MANKNHAISTQDLENSIKSNEPMLLFDLRQKDEFEKRHVKGSAHAVCDTKAKETMMPNIPKNIKVVLVSEPEDQSKQVAEMMTGFGIDTYYLQGGFSSWTGDTTSGKTGKTITGEQLLERLHGNNLFLLDVRNEDEFTDYKIPGSVNIPLDKLFQKENISKIPQDKEIVTICPHGNRAMLASFALARHQIDSKTLENGLAGWNQVLKPVKVSDLPKIFQVQKIGKGCLSYVAVSDGKAIVIDPLYPFEKYTDLAKTEDFDIIKVIDTHQHADHVSAARDLAEKTNSELHLSSYEDYKYDASFLKDKDTIQFGNSSLRVIHTPGHTPGSLSFVIDEKYVITGDILFVESIGRPDLRDKAEKFTEELYETLHNKLLKLPDSYVVLPAHHGEDVETKNDAFYSTILDSKNLPLLDLSKEKFIEKVVSITQPRPMNYQNIIKINGGAEDLVHSKIPDLEIGPNRCAVNV